MYYMCIYICTYKEREGGEGESMLPNRLINYMINHEPLYNLKM